MLKNISRKQLKDAIKDLVKYKEFVDKKFPRDRSPQKKLYKKLLIESKVKEIVDRLDDGKKEYKISVLVTENDGLNFLQKNELLLEWEQYQKIPKTNLTYRYDVGEDRPGMQDHIHVFLGKSKNQVYAINKNGTPHDGSKAKLSKKEIKFLKNLGFTPPKEGLLEWILLDGNKEFTAYKRQLLLN